MRNGLDIACESKGKTDIFPIGSLGTLRDSYEAHSSNLLTSCLRNSQRWSQILACSSEFVLLTRLLDGYLGSDQTTPMAIRATKFPTP